MAGLRKVAAAVAAVALSGGIMAAAATPAQAAWRVAYIYGWTQQASCEIVRADHGAGLDPSQGFVAPACSYNSTRRLWYYAYTYNDA
jgi:hypothetical protein